jgi:L-asparaginase
VSGKKIVVLGTGGTVAGRAASSQDNVGYVAGQVAVADLLQGVPVPASAQVVAEQVAQIDSKDMDFEVWRQLALRCTHWLGQPDVQGLLITHGTDTLEETAFFLHCVLQPAKPVVLTGAMRPATSATADGPRNLADALAVAAHPGARGVVAVLAGRIHEAQHVAKLHTSDPRAFESGDAGPLGQVDQGAIAMQREWPGTGQRLRDPAALPQGAGWPRVEIVLSHAGASGAVVEALVAQGVRGLVVAGTGNGTVHHALEAALLQAQSAGVHVLRTTRCARGEVRPHAGDRLPHAPSLSPVKARIALMLDLMG